MTVSYCQPYTSAAAEKQIDEAAQQSLLGLKVHTDLCVALTGPFCISYEDGSEIKGMNDTFYYAAILGEEEGLEAAERELCRYVQGQGISLDDDDYIDRGVVRLHLYFEQPLTQSLIPYGIEKDDEISGVLLDGFYGHLVTVNPILVKKGFSVEGFNWSTGGQFAVPESSTLFLTR